MGSSEPLSLTPGVPHASNPLPAAPLSAGRLPQELLAFWTHCAQPLPLALRRRPPLEPEEEEAEREAAAEEERRKAETPSDIEVTAPSLLPALPELQQPAFFCPREPWAPGPSQAGIQG